jgi:8-amino-7-oxononanoate synthase
MHPQKNYEKFLAENPYPREMKLYDLPSAVSNAIYLNYQGKRLLNFSANDYLGLALHPLLIARSQEYAQRWGVGSTSSRLVTGNLAIFEDLERELAAAIGKPSALIYGAGYQTNFSVLEALLDPQVLGEKPLVFCDRYTHISMLSSTQHLARVLRFRHNDYQHLQTLLEKHASSTQPKFILVESIYSMDGDEVDVGKIIALAREHQAFLYLDDAHAVGVYGEKGWGKASFYARDIDVVMGTFSKGLGSFGGYIACSETLRNYLINMCRGLIYSTGLSPAVLGAIAGAIELLPQLTNERSSLMRKADNLRKFFAENNLDCGTSTTHIIPWIIGDADKAVRTSEQLRDEGILAAPIRPPSVPANTSRIRFCLSAAHTDKDMEFLMNALRKII